MKQVLIAAIQAGDAPKVAELLQQDEKLAFARTEQGITVLLLAVYYRQEQIVHLLLEHRPTLDIFEASALGKLHLVQELLSRNTELQDALSPDGFTPLGLACFFGHEPVAGWLISNGANVNLASQNKMQVRPLHSAVANNSVPIAALLLEHGAAVSPAQVEGYTPLHQAAYHGQIPMLQLLLQYRPDLLAKTAAGQTPLDLAQAAGQQKAVQILQRAATSHPLHKDDASG